LRPHLLDFPAADPVAEPLPPPVELPAEILDRWSAAEVVRLADEPGKLADLPIDHSVSVAPTRGGSVAAGRALQAFVDRKLTGYIEFANHPDEDATSGLSPYLHFGHISAHEVFAAVMQHEGWSPGKLAEKPTGSAQGWWGASDAAEAFVDQLVTWRELGFNMCWQRPDYDQYDSLPDWAQRTLAEHADDPREFVYSLDQFAAASTHDDLWNAAQRQLLREGRIHNYLRMLWGKKIFQWSATPQDALAMMIELNDRYALDGRDPNSYSGIFWCLGRYDRAWGPERPIFGKVRYMTSENTARKLRVRAYLDKFKA
jgi:deoxyribodipyrimidine photo-lyase